MYCADSKTLLERKVPAEEYPCIPEQVYDANNGLHTGVSTVGYRSAKFSLKEASDMTQRQLALGDANVNLSERVRADSDDLIAKADALSKKNTDNITRKLRDRLHDTNFWKTELEREIRDLIEATDVLLKRKKQFENALAVLDEAVHITTDNMNARRRRYGEDLVQDEVDAELIKELDILNKAGKLYKRTIGQLETQIKRNRDFKQDLEMIWSDKQEASELLSTAGHLDVNSPNKQFFAGEARRFPKANQATVESWAQHTHDAILRSEHERMASEELNTLAGNIINDCSREIVQQQHVVNAALQRTLTLLDLQLLSYQHKLKEVVDEISRMEAAIERLRCAISDKNKYIQLVQTRLHLHNQRPGVESVRDDAQKMMLDELADLESTLDTLNDQLNVALNDLRHLHDSQMAIEKQIAMKQNSIQIDRDHVVRHRAVFPDAIRLQGH